MKIDNGDIKHYSTTNYIIAEVSKLRHHQPKINLSMHIHEANHYLCANLSNKL